MARLTPAGVFATLPGMAEGKQAAPKASPRASRGGGRKKKQAEVRSRGLEATALASADPPAEAAALARAVREDGGAALACYRDPLGGNWQVLAALPIDRVAPTPFQRDLSAAHVARLAGVIDKLDRFLDPIIAVRTDRGEYWTPNGHHRLAAMRQVGARAIVALVLPDVRTAYRILALNTEKAHNLREKCLEVVRMARDLARLDAGARDARAEQDFALEFEDPAFLTLGCCYQQNGRFPGSAYHPVLRRVEAFLPDPLPRALAAREARAAKVLELDAQVAAAVGRLEERGFQSPYLRNFVVARINPLRLRRGARADFDETIAKMTGAARDFDAGRIKGDQLARAGGAPEE